MLNSIKQLTGRKIQAADGPIGNTHDFQFDDERWVIRYLVADTANWLPGRRVLVSPYSLQQLEIAESGNDFPVKLTRDQIKNSPPLEEHMPVSRRYEQELARYYAYPMYWGAGPDLWGYSPYPILADTTKEPEQSLHEIDKSHLRSCREVTGYSIHASDGEIGHVEDFIVEDRTWAIRYLAVDTRNWLPGRKVLISPSWIHAVKWSDRAVHVAMSRDAVKGCPVYDPDSLPERDYETGLHEHYQKAPYWH